MNFRIWLAEVRNSRESIGWLLLAGLLITWSGKMVWPLTTADAIFYFPYISTHSSYSLMQAVLCLPIVMVFRTSTQKRKDNQTAVFSLLPLNPRVQALQRYTNVIVLQLLLMAATFGLAKFLAFVSPIPGYRIIDDESIRPFFASLAFSILTVAAYYGAIRIRPQLDFLLTQIFSAMLLVVNFANLRYLRMVLESERTLWFLAFGALFSVGLETWLYLRKTDLAVLKLRA